MMTAASAWDGLASELNAAAAWPPQPHPMRLDERQRHAGTTDHRPGPLGPRSCVCRNGATSVHCCQSKPVGVIVASNIIGQNTAAIAATETEYGEMWTGSAAAGRRLSRRK
jgi:hypothetical protein